MDQQNQTKKRSFGQETATAIFGEIEAIAQSYFRQSQHYVAKLSWFRTSLQNLAASANFAENFGGMRLHQT